MKTSYALSLCALAGSLACGDGSSATQDASPTASGPTWYQGIQALLVRNCSSCHTQGGIGPFPLDDYETAKTVAAPARIAIEAGIMPPWLAKDTDECAPPHEWQDDIRLSDADKKMFADWVDAGMPLGDESAAHEVIPPPRFELENPSHDMQFASTFAVSGERDLFECFVLNPEISEKSWITGVEVVPGNPKVDHHALVFLDPEGESEALATDGHFPCFSNPDVDGSLIAAWAPGALPFAVPPEAGIPIEPGARIVVQMHYHPTDSGTEMDRSGVRLTTTTEQPQWEAFMALLGNFDELEEDGSGLQPGMNDTDEPEFRIPANVKDHVENLVYRQEIPFGIPIFGVGAHMHYVGTDMKIEIKRADGSTKSDDCLLHTPRWDFDWQRSYNYDAAIGDLPVLEMGDELHLRCTYDNTMDNPAVADAVTEQGLTQPVDVFLGEETLDEMCLGIFGILVPPGVL